jgi:small subunit ribosomal protein S6
MGWLGRHLIGHKENNMPLYEHVFLARQDLATPQVDALAADFTKIIETGGGKVTKTEYWGLKTISYLIKKNRKAHYILLNIDAPYPAVAEMERMIGLSEDVIRSQTIRMDALEEGPSAQMRKERERTDRDGGGFGGREGRPPRREGGFGGGREGGDRESRPPRDRDGGGFGGDRESRPPRDRAERN